jgi:diaminopimelate decarboxylase
MIGIHLPASAPAEARPVVTAAAPNEILQEGRLGGVDPEVLAQEFGTPLYVYDLDVVDRQVDALRAVLPSRFDLAYAVKANPALAVVAHLASRGLGADVASGGELALAERAGIDLRNVIFTGPGKRNDELVAAVHAGLRAVTVESIGELERLEALSAAAGLVTPVMLRAALAATGSAERVRLVGDEGAGKFGMDIGDLAEAARRAARSPHLELLGLHAFGASNVLEAAALAEHIEATVSLARSLAVDTGFALGLVDVGGGLGIPYDPLDEPLDLTDLGARLEELNAEMDADLVTGSTRILLEPGRYLVGPSGAYLARVVDRKSVSGSTVVILDGGIHNLLRPALVGQDHRIHPLVSERRPMAPIAVAGPLCSGLDVFSRGTPMPTPEVGDLVAVLDVGAYGFTESMPLFLSHPIPAEVAVRGGRAQLIRPRMEPRAWLETQRLPIW